MRIWLVLLAIFAVLILGGLVGWAVGLDAGYILVSYNTYVIETSLWVGVGILIGLYVLLRGLIWLVRAPLSSHVVVGRWRSRRASRAARQQTVRGLLLMAEGRWEEAKKTFLKGIGFAETPLINYLNAARAAHEMGLPEERDNYLKRAHETTPGAKFAALLTQAEFQVQEGHFEQALATLISLRHKAPKHRAVLRMLAACYEALGDWQALHELLRELSDHKAVSAEEVRRLSLKVWQQIVTEDEQAAALWKRMPKNVSGDLSLITRWVDSLIERNCREQAEEAISLVLDGTWEPTLVRRYGVIYAGLEGYESQVERQLVVAQAWAKSRPSDSDLALTLGRLNMACGRFPEAREHFENALRLQASPEIYGELGRLCVALGDERRGTDYLLKAQSQLPDLKLPATPLLRSV